MKSKPGNISQALDQLRPHLEEAKEQVEDQVRKNPWAILAVVGVVAFILGWIFGPKRKR